MSIFKTADFESDPVTDATIKELFSKPSRKLKSKKIKQQKNKILKGKVVKNESISKKKAGLKGKFHVIKRNIKTTLNDNIDIADEQPLLMENGNSKQEKRKSREIKAGGSKERIQTLDPEKSTKKKKKSKALITVNNKEETSLNSRTEKSDGLKKLRQVLSTAFNSEQQEKESTKVPSLRQRMMDRLKAARFRYLNEQIYSTDSKEAQKIFTADPDAFNAYHEGYRQQVNKWPLNPVDVIVKAIQKMPKNSVIADFGCGDAKLAKSLQQKVHSFDFIAANDLVTACDMAHVPLTSSTVDVVVFCLSLMGTNIRDYLLEANRVLKPGGILKIAEVESRFDDVEQFIEGVQRFHFKNTWRDLSHNLFYFLDFKKESNIANKKKLPTISLLPCLYKKR